MCLSKVFKIDSFTGHGVGIGYKLFWLDTSGVGSVGVRLTGTFGCQDKPRPVGVWLDCEDYKPTRSELRDMLVPIQGEYEPGWHIYLTEPNWADLEQGVNRYEVIGRVRYRKLNAVGLVHDWGIPCIVAKHMIIEKAYDAAGDEIEGLTQGV